MLYSFFMTRWHNELQGDWTKEIRLNLEEFGIPCDFEYIRSTPKLSFKQQIKRRAKEYSKRKTILDIPFLQESNVQFIPTGMECHSMAAHKKYASLAVCRCF